MEFFSGVETDHLKNRTNKDDKQLLKNNYYAILFTLLVVKDIKRWKKENTALLIKEYDELWPTDSLFWVERHCSKYWIIIGFIKGHPLISPFDTV